MANLDLTHRALGVVENRRFGMFDHTSLITGGRNGARPHLAAGRQRKQGLRRAGAEPLHPLSLGSLLSPFGPISD
jgi:hypothetical protein